MAKQPKCTAGCDNPGCHRCFGSGAPIPTIKCVWCRNGAIPCRDGRIISSLRAEPNDWTLAKCIQCQGRGRRRAPRAPGVEYHIRNVVHNSPVAVFSREDFGGALEAWRSNVQHRISRMHEDGRVFAPVLGYILARPKGNPKGRRKVFAGVIHAWKQIDPPQKGDTTYDIFTSERDAVCEGYVVIKSSVSPLSATRITFTSMPNAFAYWTQNDMSLIAVRDMTVKHIRAAMVVLDSIDEADRTSWRVGNAWHNALHSELVRRAASASSEATAYDA